MGCGSVEPAEPGPSSDALIEMFHVKQSLLSDHIVDGWIGYPDCDSTLWNGLALASGMDIDLTQVEYPEDGYIQRRPKKSCWPEGSRSSVSNDMFMGLMWGAYRVNALTLLERIWDYGELHNWIMGEPWPEGVGEVLMKPHMILLLGKLTGRDPKIPPILSPVKKDYARHIQTQWITLYGAVSHQITSQHADYLKDHLENDPDDCLMMAANSLYNGFSFEDTRRCLLDDKKPPSYVRGSDSEAYGLIWWLKAAALVCPECIQ